MLLKVEKETISKEEIENLDRTNPYSVVGAFIQTISEYDPKKTNLFYEKIQLLVGEMQPISEVMKQNIKDRMLQNEKYTYIGKSYYKGSTPENDYTPQQPLTIEITDDVYTEIEEGFKKVFVKSGGADSPRGITLRLAKDGNYYLWSDSFIGVLADIKPLESTNPWA